MTRMLAISTLTLALLWAGNPAAAATADVTADVDPTGGRLVASWHNFGLPIEKIDTLIRVADDTTKKPETSSDDDAIKKPETATDGDGDTALKTNEQPGQGQDKSSDDSKEGLSDGGADTDKTAKKDGEEPKGLSDDNAETVKKSVKEEDKSVAEEVVDGTKKVGKKVVKGTKKAAKRAAKKTKKIWCGLVKCK